MTNFFEAFKNFKPKVRGNPIVKIEGKDIAVEPALYREIINHGVDCYIVINGKVTRKPLPSSKKGYLMLGASEEGYHMVDGHPYWPEKRGEGGYEWQIE